MINYINGLSVIETDIRLRKLRRLRPGHWQILDNLLVCVFMQLTLDESRNTFFSTAYILEYCKSGLVPWCRLTTDIQ